MQTPSPKVFLPLLLSLWTLTSHSADSKLSWVLEVSAGKHDRTPSVAAVSLPKELHQAAWVRTPKGRRIPLQVDPLGHGWFVTEAIPAETSIRYELDLRRKPSKKRAACEALHEGADVILMAGGRSVARYNQLPTPLPRDGIRPIYQRGAYLHPLLTPSGVAVTDDYPTNHVHHHGLWTAWTKTRFEGRNPDFWNMGEGKGTVIPLRLDDTWEGDVHAGFVARHRHLDLTAKPRKIALDEVWQVRIYTPWVRQPTFHVMDLEVHQTAHGPEPLTLLEYHYGGLGFRGRAEWNDKSAVNFLTADGITDRVKAHATRARWFAMWGKADGREVGIAILCHPRSYRFPQPMRVHPSEPFFCYSPPQAGEFAIDAASPYFAAYRFLIFDGKPDPALFEKQWIDFAEPPTVRIQPK